MAFSLNKAQLIGNLGKDAEATFTTSNMSIVKFSVATTHSKKDADGNYENLTTWHNIVTFGLNDFTKDRLKKGAKVYVEGRIDHNKYEKDGETKYFTSIIANNYDGIILLDSSKDAKPISEHETITKHEPNGKDDLPF